MVTYPPDCQILFGNIGSSVEPVRLGEQLLRFLKPNATLGIRSEALALSSVQTEAHRVV